MDSPPRVHVQLVHGQTTPPPPPTGYELVMFEVVYGQKLSRIELMAAAPLSDEEPREDGYRRDLLALVEAIQEAVASRRLKA